VNPGPYYARMEWFVDPDDIWGGMLKSSVFGFIIASVGCYRGFHAKGGAEGVGRATTRAVVASGVAVLVVDYFITLILAPMSINRA
jgi:phospholipid/cholesterol/gamma-HCH transport system permease protein